MKQSKVIWVRSQNCSSLVTWFYYQLIAKPGNKTATVPWPDSFVYLMGCNDIASFETQTISLTFFIPTIPWFLCSELHQSRIRQNTSEHFLMTKCMLLTVAISYIDTPYERVMNCAVNLQVFVTYYSPKFPFWQVCSFDGLCIGPDGRSGLTHEHLNTSSPYSTHRSQVSR